MGIIYFSRATFISKSANSVNVMKMCSSFSSKIEITLYGYKSKNVLNDNQILSHYNVMNDFQLCLREQKKFKLFEYINLVKDIIKLRDVNKTFYARDYYIALLIIVFKKDLIYEIHDFPKNTVKKLIVNYILKSHLLKRTVFISNALRNDFKIFKKFNFYKSIVAHDACNDLDIEYKEKNSLIKIGYVGGIYSGRGLNLIVKLARLNLDFEFIIVGGDKSDFVNIYGVSDIPNNVFFEGYQTQSDLIKFYQEFDVLLAPYENKVSVYGNKGDTSKYMSPLKIFEYMASKTPMIVSNIKVLNEVLEHNQNCILAEQNNLFEWNKSLNTLVSNNSLSREIAEKAYQDFINKYTWDVRTKNILEGMSF